MVLRLCPLASRVALSRADRAWREAAARSRPLVAVRPYAAIFAEEGADIAASWNRVTVDGPVYVAYVSGPGSREGAGAGGEARRYPAEGASWDGAGGYEMALSGDYLYQLKQGRHQASW